MTQLLTVSPHNPDPAAIHLAAERLRAGGLVAFPTETVYGLGANALDAKAVARIFAAKGRPATNPLIVHVADAAMARLVVDEWPEAAERLVRAFWPGPLTLVLPKAPTIPSEVTAGLEAVGVRMPAHPVALALIRAAGLPVAAPSANPYMGVSPTRAEHVARGMGDRLDVILDGGPADVGLESTVLDLTRPVPTVLRLGGLPVARLREVLGTVEVLTSDEGETEIHLPSPGLARRHYAPRAQVRLLEGREALASGLAEHLAKGHRVGMLAIGLTPVAGAIWLTPVAGAIGLTPVAGAIGAGAWGEPVTAEAMPDDPEAYGARLYAVLHEMDERGVDVLLVEAPPATEAWGAVRDRLRRATAH